MFLKAKDMQALLQLAKIMKLTTMGEVMELSKTIQAIKAIELDKILKKDIL